VARIRALLIWYDLMRMLLKANVSPANIRNELHKRRLSEAQRRKHCFLFPSFTTSRLRTGLCSSALYKSSTLRRAQTTRRPSAVVRSLPASSPSPLPPPRTKSAAFDDLAMSSRGEETHSCVVCGVDATRRCSKCFHKGGKLELFFCSEECQATVRSRLLAGCLGDPSPERVLRVCALVEQRADSPRHGGGGAHRSGTLTSASAASRCIRRPGRGCLARNTTKRSRTATSRSGTLARCRA
jgi:hypothetical protein